MMYKPETQGILQQFCNFVAIQFGLKVKTIRSDNGAEFVLPVFYKVHGILPQKSCVETLQQNGVVERKHEHLLQVARALLFHA